MKSFRETKSFYPRTENTKLPVVIFQLKEKGKVLKQIKRLVFKKKMELLYKDESSTTKPFPFSHVMAIFELPVDYKDKNLYIEVFNPWKRKVFTTPVPKKRKKKVQSR